MGGGIFWPSKMGVFQLEESEGGLPVAKLADNDQISPESVLAALLAHESESAQYVSGLS